MNSEFPITDTYEELKIEPRFAKAERGWMSSGKFDPSSYPAWKKQYRTRKNRVGKGEFERFKNHGWDALQDELPDTPLQNLIYNAFDPDTCLHPLDEFLDEAKYLQKQHEKSIKAREERKE